MEPGIEEDDHDQNHDIGGLGAPKANKHDQDHNVTKLGPHLMMITMKKIVMEGRTEPTLECSSDEGHDENLLHMTITIACTTHGKNQYKNFQSKRMNL
jgi:hypothetical protein